jgi:hypothetical protein
MKDKVDHMGLENLSRILEAKITKEMLKKLDINDLKRNNKLIDQKIDLIENKISRVLIDTLIDLQNEETPLLIKQTYGGEKCMSCNQNIVSTTVTQVSNKEGIKEKAKKTVTSKYINIADQDSVVTTFNCVSLLNLPDINTNKSSKMKSSDTENLQSANSSYLKTVIPNNKFNSSVKVNSLTKQNKLANLNSTEPNFKVNNQMINKQYKEMINEEVSKSNLDGKFLLKKADNFINKNINN